MKNRYFNSKITAFYAVLFIACAVCIYSCKKDSQIINNDPETTISLNSINLSGENRLNSVVSIYWSGSDKDGFITKFEISLDNTNWIKTNRNDSTFRFTFQPNSDTTDITFYVRSIDNDNNTDKSPAVLRVPIRNTPPTIAINKIKAPTDSVLPVFSIFYEISDIDGIQTIDSIQIKANNGNWYNVPKSSNFLTFEASNPTTTGATSFKVYSGSTPVLLTGLMNGFELNGNNRIYLRAKDNAGTYSKRDSTKILYIQSKKSDLLVVVGTATSPDFKTTILPVVASVYGNYDIQDYTVGAGKNIPPFWTPTATILYKLYDKIFFAADGTRKDGKLILEYASASLQSFLNSNGKLLVSASFPIDVEAISTVKDFSPIDSFYYGSGQARIPIDSGLVPDPINGIGYPTLVSEQFIIGIDPVFLKPNAKVLYRAQMQRAAGYAGPNVVGAKTLTPNGKVNQVFLTVEIQYLTKDPVALKDFFTKVLKNEFNW